jgi:hypothetical protein
VRIRDLKAAIRSIPYIPAAPDLHTTMSLHSQELKALSLGDTLSLLCGMLLHESAHVRRATLQKIRSVVVEHREKIYGIILVGGSGTGVLPADSPVSLLLQELLLLCRRERDRGALVACAECLGEIGAIDPARVDIVLTASRLTYRRQRLAAGLGDDDVAAGKPGGPAAAAAAPGRSNSSSSSSSSSSSPSGNGGSSGASVRDQAPWDFTIGALCLWVLEEHLAPELRTSSAAHDRTCFAIQEMLRELHRHLQSQAIEDGGHGHEAPIIRARPSCSSSSIGIGGGGGADNGANGTSVPMPDDLRQLLADRGLLEITETFWSTNYSMDTLKPVNSTPLYRPDLPFAVWIGRWARQLAANSCGPFAGAFIACRGLFRFRAELCQFLVPHVIVDVLSNAPTAREHQVHLNRIAGELCAVLEGGRGHSGSQAAAGGGRLSLGGGSGDALNVTAASILMAGADAGEPPSAATPRTLHHGHGQDQGQRVVQAVFEIMDVLSGWTAKTKRASAAAHTARARAAAAAADDDDLGGSSHRSHGHSRRDDSVPSPFLHDPYACILALLAAVPRQLLGKAAIRIRAYARALRYFEQHARETAQAARAAGGGGHVAMDVDGGSHSHSHSHSHGSARSSAIMSYFVRNDGSSGGLPSALQEEELDHLTVIYSKLDDPDALQVPPTTLLGPYLGPI